MLLVSVYQFSTGNYRDISDGHLVIGRLHVSISMADVACLNVFTVVKCKAMLAFMMSSRMGIVIYQHSARLDELLTPACAILPQQIKQKL